MDSLAAIGLKTPDYEHHPEWAALDQSGKPKLTSTAAGSKVVMCLASPFQDAAADRVNDAIERFHLAYVKLDLRPSSMRMAKLPAAGRKATTTVIGRNP